MYKKIIHIIFIYHADKSVIIKIVFNLLCAGKNSI